MNDPAFFGYGSLVNVATHQYADPIPATLHGWRRVWQRTNLREVAYLSVQPDKANALLGVAARVPGADWAALDQREAAYHRHDITADLTHDSVKSSTAVYQVRPELCAVAGDHTILLSYLDAVVQGYLQVYGSAGAVHFFETTYGWQVPILDDRADPVYPRHQRLSQIERDLVDAHLATVMQKAK